MAFDFSKIKNNKVLQVIAILAVPTIIVGGYYGYVYLKRKSDEKKAGAGSLTPSESQAELTLAELSKPQTSDAMVACRNKYKNIETVDDFIAGIQCAEQRSQAGYNVTQLKDHKPKLEQMGMVKLKKLYALINTVNKNNQEYNDFLNLMHEVYP